MDFVAEKTGLFKELQYVQGVVERKTTVPILSNLLLEADGETLALTATDLDVTIRCTCPATIQTAGSAAISARKLFDIVRLLPDAPVHFKLDAEGWVHMDCNRSRFKVACLSKDNFPEVPAVEGDTVDLPAAVLRYMISHCLFAVTQEESRYALNGALMILNDEGLAFVATDGYRLALIRRPLQGISVGEETRIIVPKKTLNELSKMTEDVESVGFGRSDNHLFFRLDRRLLVSRVLTGQFPNYDMVIPRDNDRRALVDTEAFGAALKRVLVMADEQSHGVRFSLRSGEIDLFSASPDYGEAKEAVEADYQGDSVEIAFNAQYLLDFLAVLPSDQVAVELRDSETQGLFRPKEDGDYLYQYVLMPMKL